MNVSPPHPVRFQKTPIHRSCGATSMANDNAAEYASTMHGFPISAALRSHIIRKRRTRLHRLSQVNTFLILRFSISILSSNKVRREGRESTAPHDRVGRYLLIVGTNIVFPLGSTISLQRGQR